MVWGILLNYVYTLFDLNRYHNKMAPLRSQIEMSSLEILIQMCIKTHSQVLFLFQRLEHRAADDQINYINCNRHEFHFSFQNSYKSNFTLNIFAPHFCAEETKK